jgi:hypothetical protein
LSSERTCIQELRALGLLKPQAQHIPGPVDPDAEREIARAALHTAALADLQDQRVEKHHRVDVIQRALLPRASVVHHRVSHPADQIPADVHPVDLGDVRLDIPRREAPGIQGEDLVVKPLKPPLTLAHDLRGEAPIAITRRVDRHLAVLGHQPLRGAAITRVAGPARRLLVALIPQVVGDLDLQRALDQPLGQLTEQAARTDDLLLRASARE